MNGSKIIYRWMKGLKHYIHIPCPTRQQAGIGIRSRSTHTRCVFHGVSQALWVDFDSKAFFIFKGWKWLKMVETGRRHMWLLNLWMFILLESSLGSRLNNLVRYQVFITKGSSLVDSKENIIYWRDKRLYLCLFMQLSIYFEHLWLP